MTATLNKNNKDYKSTTLVCLDIYTQTNQKKNRNYESEIFILNCPNLLNKTV